MQVAIWDTYVTKDDGQIMHFDIVVPKEINDQNLIFDYGRQYLESKGIAPQRLSAEKCRYCHVEQATSEWVAAILAKGYDIIELENCS